MLGDIIWHISEKWTPRAFDYFKQYLQNNGLSENIARVSDPQIYNFIFHSTQMCMHLCTNARTPKTNTQPHLQPCCSTVLRTELSTKFPSLLVSQWPLIMMSVCFRSLFPGTLTVSVEYWKPFREVLFFPSRHKCKQTYYGLLVCSTSKV